MNLTQDWTPRPRADLDWSSLDLQPEEGFVLSRIDGSTPVGRLPFLTGLAEDRVETILDRLLSVGALAPRPADEPVAADGGGDDSAPAGDEIAGDEGNWRRYYERELRTKPLDQRVEMGPEARGVVLRALCFDSNGKVIDALLENPDLGLEHARLIARHHRSSHGLNALGREPAFLRDRQVQSDLFRNSQTPESLLQRIFHSTNLARLHTLAVGREATERVRRASKQAFRQGFTRAGAEERVQLILKTEGRCLAMLSGVPLDGKTTALLCRRSLTSPLLIRNLARWPSTTPPVLQHLARQAIVRRSADLKNQILRHPNAPSKLDV